MDEAAIGPLIGVGKEAEVFDLGALVLKRYRRPEAKASAFREAATLAIIESLDLPAPRVGEVIESGTLWALTMSRAPGVPFGDAMRDEPTLARRFLAAMAVLQSRIHACPGNRLPDLKASLAHNIAAAPSLDPARRRLVLERMATLPDGDRLCHGDFHPGNVIGPVDHAIAIDWLDATRGDPLADVCRSYVLMRPTHPDLADAYVDAYAGVSGHSRDAILAWLPVVAAARLAEGVPGTTAQLIEFVKLLPEVVQVPR